MKKVILFALVVSCLSLVVSYAAQAAVPLKMNIQGKLVQTQGDGSEVGVSEKQNVIISLLNDNQQEVWKAAYGGPNAIQFSNGVFNMDMEMNNMAISALASASTLKFIIGKEMFLQPLTTVPYAFYAANAEKLGGKTLDEIKTEVSAAVPGGDYVKKAGDKMNGTLTVESTDIYALVAKSNIGRVGVRGVTSGDNLDFSTISAGVLGRSLGEGAGIAGWSFKGPGAICRGADIGGKFTADNTWGIAVVGEGAPGAYSTGIRGIGSAYGGSFEATGGYGAAVSARALKGTAVSAYSEGGHAGFFEVKKDNDATAVVAQVKGNNGVGIFGSGNKYGGEFYGEAAGVYGTGSSVGGSFECESIGVYAKGNPAVKANGAIVGSGIIDNTILYPAPASDALMLGSGKTGWDVVVKDDLFVKNYLKTKEFVATSGANIYGQLSGPDKILTETLRVGGLDGSYNVSTMIEVKKYGTETNSGTIMKLTGYKTSAVITSQTPGSPASFTYQAEKDGSFTVFGSGKTEVSGPIVGTKNIPNDVTLQYPFVPANDVSTWATNALVLGTKQNGWDVLVHGDLVVSGKLVVGGYIWNNGATVAAASEAIDKLQAENKELKAKLSTLERKLDTFIAKYRKELELAGR